MSLQSSGIRQQSEGSDLWLPAAQLKFAHNRIPLLDSLAPPSMGLNRQLSPDDEVEKLWLAQP